VEPVNKTKEVKLVEKVEANKTEIQTVAKVDKNETKLSDTQVAQVIDEVSTEQEAAKQQQDAPEEPEE